MRRFLALLGLLAGLGVAGVAGAVPALAHAELVSADPADGQRLARAPAAVTLRFSEPVSIDTGYLRVLDAAGRRVDAGPPSHPAGDPTSVAVPLTRSADGGYIVSWRVVSADSHPVGGAYSFAVGSGTLLTPSGADSKGAADPAVQWVFTVTRWVGFAGLVLLGAAVFLTVCWRDGRAERRPRQLVWAGWGAVAGSTGLGLLLEGPYGAGTGLGRLLSPGLLSATLHTTYGRMLSARLVLLAVLAVLLVRLLAEPDSPPWLEDAAALAGLGILATYAGAGHAVSGGQTPVAVFADAVHLAAMSAWLGGLVVIAACLLRRRDVLARALPAFSRVAMACVAVLILTGTYRSWRDIGSWAALFGTPYGRIVVVKILLLAGLVLLGNASRQWVRRVAAGHGSGTGPRVPSLAVLRKSVVAELCVAAIVLGFTAVLVAEPPARASYSRPASTTVALTSGDRVQVTVTPATAGRNEVHVYVLGTDGRPRDAVSFEAFARLPGTQYDRLPVALVKAGPGHWVGSAVSLPVAGHWQLEMNVRLAEFDAYAATATVEVR